MPPANLITSNSQALRLILYSIGLLFLINVSVSIFLAQFFHYWYSDVEWDPVRSQERKKVPELCVTTALWMYASWHTYLKIFSLEVVPQSVTPSQASPIHIAAVPKSLPTVIESLDRQRGGLGPVTARREHALQVLTPPHRQSPTDPPPARSSHSGSQASPVLRPLDIPMSGASAIDVSGQSSDLVALNYFKASGSRPSPVLRPLDIPMSGASAIDVSGQPRDLVTLNYFKASGSRPSPVLRPLDIPMTGASAVDISGQSSDLVPLNYFKADYKDEPQEDHIAAMDGISMVASVQPIDTQSSADCDEGSRGSSLIDSSEDIETWGEHIRLELINLPYGPSEEEMRRRIRFFPHNSGMAQKEIDEARKPYERVCYRQSPRNSEPFEIDGRPETYQLDRIKCWVNFNQHLTVNPPWPKEYFPVCTKKELLQAELYANDDDAFSVYTMQTMTASSLA